MTILTIIDKLERHEASCQKFTRNVNKILEIITQQTKAALAPLHYSFTQLISSLLTKECTSQCHQEHHENKTIHINTPVVQAVAAVTVTVGKVLVMIQLKPQSEVDLILYLSITSKQSAVQGSAVQYSKVQCKRSVERYNDDSGSGSGSGSSGIL